MRGDEERQGRAAVLGKSNGHEHPDRVLCPRCGARNPEHYAFCHRCAQPLAAPTEEADPALVLIPVIGMEAGDETAEPAAGEAGEAPAAAPRAPEQRRPPARPASLLPDRATLRRMLLGVEVAMVATFGGVPATRDAFTGGGQQVVTAIRRAVWPAYGPVGAQSLDLASYPDLHTTWDALDGDTDTYWQGWLVDRAAPPAMRIAFDRRTDVSYVGFTGATTHDAALPTVSPRQVRLAFSNGTTKDITLGAERGYQAVRVSATGVAWVRVEVLSTWGPASSPAAIGEVEFFTQE